MAVSLQKVKKGGRVNLTKGTGLKKALLGLGWDVNRYEGSDDFDLDLVLFLCDENKKCISDAYIVFYNNPEDPNGAVQHSGDNRTGEGDGDDESATIDFSKVPENVKYIILAVTIDQAKARNQNFGLVDNSYVHVANAETGEDLVRYDLGEDFSTQTSVIFAELYRQDKEWKFRAVGEGYEKELSDLCGEYGLEVAG